jgi:ATP-dependent Clp protease protease subunit
MIHQPSAGTSGQVSDIEIMTKEFLGTKKRLNELLVIHTGQPLSRIEADTDRNFFMSAVEAKDYGLIDKVYQFDIKGQNKK